MRILVVSRQRTVAKTQTEIYEGYRDQVQRVPKGISGQYRITADNESRRCRLIHINVVHVIFSKSVR